jgi:hypothetical protein
MSSLSYFCNASIQYTALITHITYPISILPTPQASGPPLLICTNDLYTYDLYTVNYILQYSTTHLRYYRTVNRTMYWTTGQCRSPT